MKETKQLYLLVLVSALGIAGISGCSETPKEDDQGWHFSSSHSNSSTGDKGGINSQGEEEGPQYQTPTMQVLQGKMQKFPARYPIQRYPNAQVAIVDVRANRPPGYLNQVMLKTTDAVPKVDSFYEQKLLNDRWKKVSDYQSEIYGSTHWEKDDLQCEVRVSQDFSQPNGKRFIQLLYGRKPKPIITKQFTPHASLSSSPSSSPSLTNP